MEMSHRSAEFEKINREAEADLRSLLEIPDNYSVLFMPGKRGCGGDGEGQEGDFGGFGLLMESEISTSQVEARDSLRAFP